MIKVNEDIWQLGTNPAIIVIKKAAKLLEGRSVPGRRLASSTASNGMADGWMGW